MGFVIHSVLFSLSWWAVKCATALSPSLRAERHRGDGLCHVGAKPNLYYVRENKHTDCCKSVFLLELFRCTINRAFLEQKTREFWRRELRGSRSKCHTVLLLTINGKRLQTNMACLSLSRDKVRKGNDHFKWLMSVACPQHSLACNVTEVMVYVM